MNDETEQVEAVEAVEEAPKRRTRRRAKPPEDVQSSLPEKFEVFEQNMMKQEAKAPEPKAKTRPIGGMVKKAWAGIPMWECPRCGATTFDEAESKVHTCKEVRTVDDLPEEPEA